MLVNDRSVKDHLFVEYEERVLELIDIEKFGKLLISIAALAGITHCKKCKS
jgi:hypothetical protein